MDRAVLTTVAELFEARHFPSVVALATEALDAHPEHVPMLLLRARARTALRRDLEAQADLRDVIRIDPQCALAYRLLGQLAARRDEYESAAIFFAEALRLDPHDDEADTWLAIVKSIPRSFAIGSSADLEPYKPEPEKTPVRVARHAGVFRAYPATSIPEAPGFGEYLVEIGVLTHDRLRAALTYQRSMNVQLSTAVVTLGLASPQRMEWAVVAHQSTLASRRGG